MVVVLAKKNLDCWLKYYRILPLKFRTLPSEITGYGRLRPRGEDPPTLTLA